MRDLRERLEALVVAVERVAFTHRWSEKWDSWEAGADLPPDVGTLRSALLDAKRTLARASSPAPGSDARALPDGTLVTCEHCPTSHPKGDDGRPCRFPKVAPPSPESAPCWCVLTPGDSEECPRHNPAAPAPRPEETRPEDDDA